ncbi:MAG: response regulator [Sulfurospirillaceae bacterium]|nr:response regulator [Sulfurospirillaceae bacterium]
MTKKQRNLDILNQFSILYIEDEPELLKHTKTVLEDFVKNIYAVESIELALEAIKKHHIDVIVSDILLKNENGIEFIRLLKNEYKINIPTILMTAHTDTEYLLDAIKLKVQDYIVKPVNIKDLLNALHDILLPKAQQKEIEKFYRIIKTISAVTDSKQIELIRFIIKNLDDENMLNCSYSDIMARIDISKPTVIKVFKQLIDLEILTKIQNGKYLFNENRLPSPE